MKVCRRTFEVKEGRVWVESLTWDDPSAVYEHLSRELIAKKINGCSYIRSIKRENLYNGHERITVTYSGESGGGRSVYIIPN